MDDAVDELARRAGASFEGLRRARERSQGALSALREACSSLSVPARCSVVAEGSLGRLEMTSGSDLDFLLLALDEEAGAACADLSGELEVVVRALGHRMPTIGGPFGSSVNLSDLATKIGGDPDRNEVVTHRMLLLLESTSIAGDQVWEEGLASLLDVYLAKITLKDHRPPRFLLNDLIRYWRTICVDYEGKLRQAEGQKWAIRNAKLRTVRKMLFAGGLFPLLECSERDAAEIPAFLSARLRLPPADRIALTALAFDGVEAGAEALTAYSDLLERLDDPAWRSNLEELPFESRSDSLEHQQVKEIGQRFQEGLEALLFDTSLGPVARRYLVF